MNKKDIIFLSVVIPCYNEEANLKRGVLGEVNDYLQKQKYSWEVIISDDGSTDKSKDLAEKFAKANQGFRLLKNQHGGKPYAVWQGIKKARGQIVLFTDMDQSTPLGNRKAFTYFKKNYEVVIGSEAETNRCSFLPATGSLYFCKCAASCFTGNYRHPVRFKA